VSVAVLLAAASRCEDRAVRTVLVAEAAIQLAAQVAKTEHEKFLLKAAQDELVRLAKAAERAP
jgi:hypothetical protein